jgi:dipeptidyl aminopeptidase/acylaminoacyl peptidase
MIDTRWTVIDLDGRSAAQDVGDGGELVRAIYGGLLNGTPVSQSPQWSPDARWIAYTSVRNGEVQLWRSSKDGRRQEQLTRNGSDVKAFSWTHDGENIFFAVGPTRREVEREVESEAQRGFHYDNRFAPVASLRPIIVAKNANQIWVYELATHRERLASQSEIDQYRELVGRAEGRSTTQLLRRASRADMAVWLEDLRPLPRQGVRQELTVVAQAPGQGKPIICGGPSCSGYFRGLWMSGDGTSAYFWRFAGPHNHGFLALYEWHISAIPPRLIFQTNELVDGCTLTQGRLICGMEGPTKPTRLVEIELRSGRTKTLFDPNPQFTGLQLGEVVPLEWTDQNGIRGWGHLIKPIGFTTGKRYPLVIVQYRSRGFLRGGVGDEYPIQMYAAKGFAVLSFDRPDDWEAEALAKTEEDVTRRRYEDFHDVRRVTSVLFSGIDKLATSGLIDSRRVGITGLSDGGETAAYALIQAPERFAAAAVSWTWWNPILFYLAGPKFQPVFRRMGFEDPANGAAEKLWKGHSIALNATQIQAPILLQVSDTEVLPETQTVAALEEAGKPVDMYIFPNEGHIKSQPLHRYNVYRRSVQWFEFWLQGGKEESDAVDGEQYRHWEALCDLQRENNPDRSTFCDPSTKHQSH